MADCPWAPLAGPGAWAWLGLWLPAGGALGCLAGPAERQSAPLGALRSAWVERVKSIYKRDPRASNIGPIPLLYPRPRERAY